MNRRADRASTRGPALRAAALAVSSIVLGAVGHTAIAGTAPDPGPLVLFGVLIAVLVSAVAEQATSRAATLARLAASPVLLHVTLAATAGHHGVAASSGAMLAVHAAAVLVTAFTLDDAQRALVALGAAWRRILTLVLAEPGTPAGPAVALPAAPPLGAVGCGGLRSAAGTRGPPRPA